MKRTSLHLMPIPSLVDRLKSEAKLQAKENGFYISVNQLAIGYLVAGLEQSAMRRRSAGKPRFGAPSILRRSASAR
jgi:hypothetical protein